MPLEGSVGSSGWDRKEHSTPRGNIHTHEVGLNHGPGRAPPRGVAALVTPKTCNTLSFTVTQLSLYLQECEDLLLITSFMLSAPESSSSSVKRPARGAPGRPWVRISVKYGTQKFENIPWQEHMLARRYVCKKYEMHDTD